MDTKRFMRRALLAAAALLVVGASPGESSAQASPVDVVRDRNQAVTTALDAAGDSISDDVREELKDVINGLIDFPELSRRALRRYWSDRTPEEQQSFIETFRELVRSSSVQKLEVYQADSITYQPAETEGDRSRVTTAAHEGKRQVEVVYLMHRVDGEWKAYDVIIDGSSTLRTYQDSFQQEIRATSYEEMYSRMLDRLEQERAKG